MKTRFDMLESLIDNLGEHETLESIVKALSDFEMKDLYDYICRCWDIPNINEEIEETEEA